MKARQGFTLIELLVVIAIIAILAAILFPVFATARERGRAASCTSNMKQIALGVLQYADDYDGSMPPVYYEVPAASLPPGATSNLFMWPRLVNPYIKDYAPYYCPSNTKDPYNIWGGGPPTSRWFHNWQRWPSYGINWDYLNPSYWDGSKCLDPKSTKLSEIAQTASTVMLVDTKTVGDDTDGWYLSAFAESPAIITAPDVCSGREGASGWGKGSYADDGTYGPVTGTGDFSPRHLSGGHVAFMDGHVKWFTAGRLAQGTNWHKDINNSAVEITDESQYLWDLK